MSEREIVTLGQIRREIVGAVQRLVPVDEATALVIATHALRPGTERETVEAWTRRFGSDTLDRFLDEVVVTRANPRGRCRSSDLYAAWEAWCAGRGLDPGSNKALSMEMVRRGFRKARTHRGAEFFGIEIARDDGDAG